MKKHFTSNIFQLSQLMAVANKDISSAYGGLGHSHKVNLTYAPDDKKEELISEIIKIEAETNKKCSVVKIRELISKHKRELNPADISIAEILTIDLATFNDNILKDLQKDLHAQYKKLQEKIKLYKAKSDEITNLLGYRHKAGQCIGYKSK